MKPYDTDRQSDAMTVQRAFSMTTKVLNSQIFVCLLHQFVLSSELMADLFLQDSAFSNSKGQSYISEVIVASPLVNHCVPLPIVPQLQSAPRALPLRVAAMFKVLVSLFSLMSVFSFLPSKAIFINVLYCRNGMIQHHSG